VISPVLCCCCCRAAELRRCCCLRELHLEHNRLVTPLLDLTHATALGSLQVMIRWQQHRICAVLALLRAALSARSTATNESTGCLHQADVGVFLVLSLRLLFAYPTALRRYGGVQLYGNPLDYLPELGPAVGLRSLSLANVRILADAAYSR
jgi:hypothetical protein